MKNNAMPDQNNKIKFIILKFTEKFKVKSIQCNYQQSVDILKQTDDHCQHCYQVLYILSYFDAGLGRRMDYHYKFALGKLVP